MASAFALAIIQRNQVFISEYRKRLRTLRYPIFTGRVVTENRLALSVTYGDTLSQRERPWQKDELYVDGQRPRHSGGAGKSVGFDSEGEPADHEDTGLI